MFTNKFSKSIAALLLKYNEAPIILKDDYMIEYLCDFIENGDIINHYIEGQFDRLSDWTFWNSSFNKEYPFKQMNSTRNAAYLLTIFMLLFAINRDLHKDNLYDLENLSEMMIFSSSINTFISSLIMDFDFRDYGSLNFNSNYMPNVMVSEYIGNMYRTEHMLTQYREFPIKQNISLDKELLVLNKKIDKDILITGITFMQIQAILLLMECSTLYSKNVRMISKSILMIFKEILANARIRKIEIDTAICTGTIRKGTKKTTGIKIFFALENLDRYCLRLDFPHKGEEFLHYNLHEPGRKTALPLSINQYNELKNKYVSVDDIFFRFGNLYWFRNNFISKLDKLSPPDYTEEYESYSAFRKEMLQLFQDQGHYRIFSDDISKDDMIDFIGAFGSALSQNNISSASYADTDNDNIDKELTKIKLKDILSNALAIYQRCSIEEQFFNISYDEPFAKLKTTLLEALYNNFSDTISPFASYEEIYELKLKDILLILDELCD